MKTLFVTAALATGLCGICSAATIFSMNSSLGTWSNVLTSGAQTGFNLNGVGTDKIQFGQVEHQADDVVGQLEHLRGHRVLEPLDTRDAVAHLDNGAHFLEIHPRLVLLDTRLKDAGYLLRTQLQLNPPC